MEGTALKTEPNDAGGLSWHPAFISLSKIGVGLRGIPWEVAGGIQVGPNHKSPPLFTCPGDGVRGT